MKNKSSIRKQDGTKPEDRRRFQDRRNGESGTRAPSNKPTPANANQQNKRSISYQFPDHNDWSWYAPSELVAKQIANIPFNVLSGMPLPVTIGVANGTAVIGKEAAPSTLMGARLNYYPSFGVSSSTIDGITMAANQLYAYVRKANSGGKVYESPDLMITILALQEVMRVMFEIRRALTYSLFWTFWNKYVPKAMFERMLGINYDDLAANRANYVAQYNLLVQRVNTFALPKYFKSMLRAAYISSSIFMDSDAVTGQMYAFVAKGYYKFSATGSDKGSSLVFTPYQYESSSLTTTRKLSYMLGVVSEQIDAIFGDVDAQTMFGDLYKAFGADGMYQLPELTVDETMQPIFDIDILAQIENASFLKPFYQTTVEVSNDSLDVTQNEGQTLIWQPEFNVKVASDNPSAGTSEATARPFFFLKDRVINSHVMEPQYSDVLEWTRLMATYSATTNADATVVSVTSSGAELLENMTIYQMLWTNPDVPTISSVEFNQFTDANSQSVNGTGNTLALFQMDWHPIIYQLSQWYDYTTKANVVLGGDLKRPTVITEDVIKRINEAANYALYYSATLLHQI